MKDDLAGVWYVLHTNAIDTNTRREQQFFIQEFYRIINKLKCDECRRHAAEYARNHNIRSVIDVISPNKRNGLFYYTWQFHNAVNRRIGKRTITFEEAWDTFAPDHLKYYTRVNVCTSCGG